MEKIVVCEKYKKLVILIEDILYIDAQVSYTRIVRVDGSSVRTRMGINAVMAMLPTDKFIRIHRSYGVAIGQITAFTRSYVVVKDNKQLPLGRTYIEVMHRSLGC